jgi:chromate reductase, NAD(P)H dehydrogenase (quinone)
MRLLGIPGSLRRDSHNRRLLVATGRALPPGARLVIWDGLAAIPPFNEDREHPTPPAVERLRRAIAEADGVLIATPEYNGSIPGQLKNALDWASRPPKRSVLAGKPVAVMGASPSPYGAARAQAELRKILTVIGAVVTADELAVPHVTHQLEGVGLRDPQLRDPQLREQLAVLVGNLCCHTWGRQVAA